MSFGVISGGRHGGGGGGGGVAVLIPIVRFSSNLTRKRNRTMHPSTLTSTTTSIEIPHDEDLPLLHIRSTPPSTPHPVESGLVYYVTEGERVLGCAIGEGWEAVVTNRMFLRSVIWLRGSGGGGGGVGEESDGGVSRGPDSVGMGVCM